MFPDELHTPSRGDLTIDDQDLQTNMGENDMWVLKTDSNGELQWQHSLGGAGIDMAFDVLEQADGSLILAGQSGSPEFNGEQHLGGTDLMLIKFR